MLNEEVRAFLDARRFAVLATLNADGSPQQSVMWYELVDDKLMMNTINGRLKAANIGRDPRVSICVEDEYDYVSIRGRATLDTDPERAQNDIARLARRYHPADKAEEVLQAFRAQERVSIWIDIDHVFTKF